MSNEESFLKLFEMLGGVQSSIVKLEQRIVNIEERKSRAASPASTPEKLSFSPPSPSEPYMNSKEVFIASSLKAPPANAAVQARRSEEVYVSERRGSIAEDAKRLGMDPRELNPMAYVSMGLNSPQVFATQASYDHIKLTSTGVRSFEQFIDAIRQYQFKNRIRLAIPPLISDKVRLALVNFVKYQLRRNITDMDFYTFELNQIEEVLRAYCRPANKMEFANVLRRSIEFKLDPDYKLVVTKFRPMYEALCAFKELYTRTYDFLADGSNVPACNNKDGGLVQIVCSKVPFRYIEGVLQHLGKFSFSNIQEMWEEIFRVVEEDNDQLKKTLRIYYRFLSAEPSKKYDSGLKSHVAKVLNHIPEHNPFVGDSFQEYDHEDDLELLIDNLEAEQEIIKDVADFAALVPAPKVQTTKPILGCQRMLLYGTCEGKTNCRYSHVESDLKNYWVQLNRAMQNSKYKPSGLPSTQLRHISLNDDAVMSTIFHSTFLNLNPMASVLRAVYKEGELVLTSGEKLRVPKILMDSGALTANYIDSNFVSRHEEALRPFIKPCKMSVRLGDYETIREVNAIAHLEMEFMHRGVKYHIKERFQVLDMHCSNDVIVGLPTIVHKLSRLFQYMMEDAVHEGQVNSVTAGDLEQASSPWTALREDVPEEIKSYEPSSFSYALHFMSMTRTEAIAEYESQFSEHVSPEMKESTMILNLLRSDKAKQCFVPEDWTGINGVPPLELEFKSDIPVLKPKVRPLNPRLAKPAEEEMNRLRRYHYRKSTSQWASPLVIAPKSTKPFIRFCGDYVIINRYIIWKHQLIPTVKHQIERIIRHGVFVDIDMVNAFHQIRLAEDTSRKLSVVTPWGQFEPLFLPEGVTPASGILQELVSSVFSDFTDWLIVIFDNLLILAHDYVEAYDKFEKFIDRCVERNVKLKFAKTWVGFKEVKFFGFLCRHNSYDIMPERINGINSIPFPSSTKKMLSFLGMTLFCSRFIEKYVEYASPLYDMTKKNFNWDERTWVVDYKDCFERMKEAVKRVASLFYPDYDLVFVLETDWSKIGVSAKLVQVRPVDRNGVIEYDEELIGLISKKMSGAAQNWDPMKGEAFGVYYGIYGFSYYLRGTDFYVKTDHANLRYIEQSTVPIIVRWHQYMQSFRFKILAQPGKVGFVPDYYSRLSFLLDKVPGSQLLGVDRDSDSGSEGETIDFLLELESVPVERNKNPEHYIALVHGGRNFHHGERRTWLLLNNRFPGHSIPYAYVAEYVAKCSTCQKNRLGMTDNILPLVRHIKVDHYRKRIALDTLFITPTDMHGNCVAHIVVNMFTRLIDGYPVKSNDAIGVATALFQYQCRYGMFEEWLCDPASNFTADVMKHLALLFGSRQLFSIVDRHEANGVEGPNKIILNHVYALCADECIKDRWSDVTVWPLVIYEANYWKSTETPYSALQLTFGADSEIYHKLPADATMDSHLHEYVGLLQGNMQILRSATKKYQENLILKRTSTNPPSVNRYQPGDFVLVEQNKPHKTSKLTPRFAGPFQVIKHTSNDVECRHLVAGFVKSYHVEKLKIFHGDYEKAYRTALEDNNQSVIAHFLYHRGDSERRKTMQFKVEFADGDILWLPWSQDLSSTIPFEDYCRGIPELYILLFSDKDAQDFKRKKQKTSITQVEPNDIVFVPLRSYGDDWFHNLNLPEHESMTYVVQYRYVRWLNKEHTLIEGYCSVFNETFRLQHYFVYCFGSVKKFDSGTMILVDTALVSKYPKIMATYV